MNATLNVFYTINVNLAYCLSLILKFHRNHIYIYSKTTLNNHPYISTTPITRAVFVGSHCNFFIKRTSMIRPPNY